MPRIRYTYYRDVERYGEVPIEVPQTVAQVLVVERRRAELVSEPEPVIEVPAAPPAGDEVP